MRPPLAELAGLFLRLGTTAFGGPAAHIAMMEDEVVRRRGWLTREEFLDLLGATNLIPGPNSTELAIHIGHRRAGWPGLLVAGTAFIVPAMLIVTGFGWAYVRFGALPETRGLLYGIKPVVIAIVLQALWALGRAAIRSWSLALIGVAAVVASAAGVGELTVLAIAAVAAVVLRRVAAEGSPAVLGSSGAASLLAGSRYSVPQSALAGVSAAAFGLGPLFWVFFKTGAVLFGSGYVLLAFLRTDLVERLHWLTEAQLLDAVAVGQITPGPVFTTATFVGYILGGMPAALVATAGIFLPAFIYVALSGPLVPRIRRSPTAGAALDGVIVASLGLMATVTWQLGRSALVDSLTAGVAFLSAILLLRYRLNSVWLIVGGAVLGLVITGLRA
ncbi:MAG TPA: chromate efflux transporter [Gemmatimonadales bacterium]|nr:chromate efflux transporter [Gemmatimonadales bacterium]